MGDPSAGGWLTGTRCCPEIVRGGLQWLGLRHRSSYRLMLERMTGTQPIDSLNTLADILERIKHYGRIPLHYTVDTPLNRLVDSVQPESATARTFAGWIEDLPAHQEEVRNQLTMLRDNREAVLPVLQHSALLQEDIPLAEDVAALADAGLGALDYLNSGKPAPPAWISAQVALLNRAAKPRAEMDIVIVAPIRKLVEMAGKGPQ
jgi:hypothetical protein